MFGHNYNYKINCVFVSYINKLLLDDNIFSR